MTDYREQLRGIRTFPMLVRFLRDELQWPIDSAAADFEDLTFHYTPEELGIDPANAANIEEIKQLRRLSPNQPWGVFFIKFEPKRLPIVALRRILGRLVIKKRATAGAGERPRWSADDLLFISNYGDGHERKISFAHFSQDPKTNNLPTLKVLAWDDLDTPLHLEHAANTLVEKLAWPSSQDESDKTMWRNRWRSAFELEYREVVTTSKVLAVRLAALARRIRTVIREVLKIETDGGPMKQLMKAFQDALVHDLDGDGFADMYAQTIAYGLLSARIADPTAERTSDLAANIRTSPFLRELMESFIHVGGSDSRRGLAIDFDELGVSDVVALLDRANFDAILRDFGDRNPLDDPVIHFYELFLREYDAKRRMQRGVFYTPRPVVSYIVRSVHELLQTEFGLIDGLADTATWGEMIERREGLSLPSGIGLADRFVTILDPATGTGTFLVEAIDVIHRTVMEKWTREGHGERTILDLWNEYVPTHLLPRLHGYELLMAPYAIAHLKISLKLHETGYRFQSENGAQIYLTNTLEPPVDFSSKFEFAIPALAREAEAVNNVKQRERFTVVIGNPPYSGISANMSEAVIALVEPYKSIDGVPLGERKIWTQDDYKKFMRFAQLRISDSGSGIVGFITNHGFINEPTSRGMRHSLLGTFPNISVLNLHGSLKKRETSPDGSPDKNVFDIESGVAISLLWRGGGSPGTVAYSDAWGLREEKYSYLLDHTQGSAQPIRVLPSPEFYLFVPQDEHAKTEFSKYVSVTDVFVTGSNGIQTSRDHVVYGRGLAQCHEVIEEFRLPESVKSTQELRDKYWPGKAVANYAPGDTRGWRLTEARQRLRKDPEFADRFKRALYRPFDWQTLFYADYMIDWPRLEVMGQMLRPNLSLCVGRAGSAADNQDWSVVFVADTLVDMNLFYRGGNVNYPLRVGATAGGLDLDQERQPNFGSAFVQSLNSALALSQPRHGELPQGISPELILHYAYAVFHSPGYRNRYGEFLKIDFPRLPLTSSLELFHELARLGGALVALHLVEAPAQKALSAHYNKADQVWRYEVGRGQRIPVAVSFDGPRRPVVDRVGWSSETVWIDAIKPAKGSTGAKVAGTIGFRGLSAAVWNFRIGGYQVCEKWLKDRKGLILDAGDLAHYYRIVVAIHETIRIMAEIDHVIEAHGGWPSAFVVRGNVA